MVRMVAVVRVHRLSLAASTGGMGAVGGHRCPAIVQLVQEVQTTRAAIGDGARTAVAGAAGAADHDRQSRHAAPAQRHGAQLLAGELDAGHWPHCRGRRRLSVHCRRDVRNSRQRQCRVVSAAARSAVAGRAATHSRLAPVERHAAGAVASSLAQCQQPLRIHSKSDRAIRSAAIRRASWICRPASAPSSACCRTSKPSCRFSTRRLRRKIIAAPASAGNRSVDGQGRFATRFQPVP